MTDASKCSNGRITFVALPFSYATSLACLPVSTVAGRGPVSFRPPPLPLRQGEQRHAGDRGHHHDGQPGNLAYEASESFHETPPPRAGLRWSGRRGVRFNKRVGAG